MKKYLFLLTTICVAAFCGCKKEYPTPMPQFERTFVWGETIAGKEVAQLVAASADSAQVVKIIFQSDGKDWGGNSDVTKIFENKIQPTLDACGKNQSKLVHTGIIYRPLMRDDTPEQYAAQQADSAKLVNMGYTIVDPVYHNK